MSAVPRFMSARLVPKGMGGFHGSKATVFLSLSVDDRGVWRAHVDHDATDYSSGRADQRSAAVRLRFFKG